MIHEFQGNKPIFQPLHTRNMMDVKDNNYKPIRHTPREAVKLDENFAIAKFGASCDNLQIDKVYATRTNEIQLYEQP
jgi:hypothetical protein